MDPYPVVLLCTIAVRQWDPQPKLGWDGTLTPTARVGAGKAELRSRLRDGVWGTCKGFAIDHWAGTGLKQEEASVDSTCPDLCSSTQPTRTHAGHCAAAPYPVTPCHPARLPACLPKICPSGG